MVGPQHDPATEAIAQVDDSHTAAEAHDAGQGHSQCGDEDIVLMEEGQVADDADPDEQCRGAQRMLQTS